jgi:hypothetical protein
LVVLLGFTRLGLGDTTVGEEDSQEKDVVTFTEGGGADTRGQELHLIKHYGPETCLVRQ